MHLSGIEISAFRSLYAAKLALKPLTLIIGPNGSGKSNLFKALRFLHVGVAGDIKEWQAYEAQLDDLLWYGTRENGSRPDHFALILRFEESAVDYGAEFFAEGTLKISQETLAHHRAASEPFQPFLYRTGNQVLLPNDPPQGSMLTAEVRSLGVLSLREFGPTLPPGARDAYRHIAGWRFFDVDPRRARQGQFIPPDPTEVPPLEPDASNLSAFLYALHRLRPYDFAAVLEAVRRSIELPQGLLVEHDAERGGRQARYRFIEAPFGEDRPIPPESMSDGTIRLLAHMALLLADRTATLACLEEPDSGLHPRLMIHLADALRQAAAERQVLVTTHSPELMDCFDLTDEQDSLQVFVADRNEQGQTQFLPMTAEEFAPWLEKYRLGEAVRRHIV
jgi:predicted ATPase